MTQCALFNTGHGNCSDNGAAAPGINLCWDHEVLWDEYSADHLVPFVEGCGIAPWETFEEVADRHKEGFKEQFRGWLKRVSNNNPGGNAGRKGGSEA